MYFDFRGLGSLKRFPNKQSVLIKLWAAGKTKRGLNRTEQILAASLRWNEVLNEVLNGPGQVQYEGASRRVSPLFSLSDGVVTPPAASTPPSGVRLRPTCAGDLIPATTLVTSYCTDFMHQSRSRAVLHTCRYIINFSWTFNTNESE